nr:MAG TPA: Minor capsid protein [Bacteriophage sp.]
MKLTFQPNSRDLADLASPEKILERHGLGPMGPVQKAIDAEVIRQCEPYVPYDTGILAGSASESTDIGSGQVVYGSASAPYAHYQYYGEVYGPNFLVEVGGEMVWRSLKNGKKSPTGRKLQYDKEVHPQAGSFWFERAMADHKEDVLTAAKEAIR